MPTAGKSVIPIKHLGAPGLAAMAACTICCVTPILAVGASTVTALFRLSPELWVSGATFAVTLGATALHAAIRPPRKGREEACRQPGSCGGRTGCRDRRPSTEEIRPLSRRWQ